MANRGRAARRRARRKAEQGSLVSAGELVVAPLVEASEVEPSQGLAADAPLQIETPWSPTSLSQDGIAQLEAKGMGAEVEVTRHRWLDIRAIKEQWPISREMRERIVFDSINTMLNPKATIREKQMERRLLLAMQGANTNKNGLPTQVDVGVTSESGGETTVSVRLGGVTEIVDLRDDPVVPGSEDDYAE